MIISPRARNNSEYGQGRFLFILYFRPSLSAKRFTSILSFTHAFKRVLPPQVIAICNVTVIYL
jgi:hypothetical protein